MILMVMIINMRDQSLSDRLQLETKLTLESAVTALRNSEELVCQKQELEIADINYVKKPLSHIRDSPKQSAVPRADNRHTENTKYRKQCIWCGHTPSHRRGECPARNEQCSSCKRIGHFASVCLARKPKVRECTSQDHDSEDGFVGSVSDTISSDPWSATLLLNESDSIRFKIDTGADVSILPADIKLKKKIPLQKSNKNTLWPGRI